MKYKEYKDNEVLPVITSYLERIDKGTLEELSNNKGEDNDESETKKE